MILSDIIFTSTELLSVHMMHEMHPTYLRFRCLLGITWLLKLTITQDPFGAAQTTKSIFCLLLLLSNYSWCLRQFHQHTGGGRGATHIVLYAHNLTMHHEHLQKNSASSNLHYAKKICTGTCRWVQLSPASTALYRGIGFAPASNEKSLNMKIWSP
jgi:hypothetical protein